MTDNLILIAVGIGIIWQSVKLIQHQKKLRKEMDLLKKANDDLNIEFGSLNGEGIELVKKQYPDIEFRDDHRTGLEDVNKS